PGALLALVGGAVADRIERRRILVRTYAIAAAVSVIYVALCISDVREIWPVFPLAAIVGSAGAFTNPARASLLPQLVPRPQLQNGVILGTMGFMAALQFLGPSIAGLVVDGPGLAAAFGLEVALLAAGAVAFGGLRTPPVPPSGRDVLGDLADGLRYAATHPVIRALLLLALVPGVFFIGPFAVTIALLVPDVLGAEDTWLGLLWGCFRAGRFAGTLALAVGDVVGGEDNGGGLLWGCVGAGVRAGSLALTLRPLPRRGVLACIPTTTGGAILVAFGASASRPLAAALLFAWGV